MKKLYTYAPLENTVMTEGLLSPAKCHNELKHYQRRVGCEDKAAVLEWLEKSFEGRSRSVSCLTEPIQWQGNDEMLRVIAENNVLFSYDLDELLKDGIVEAVYCKDGSDAGGANENFAKISGDEIDFSPLPWHKCSREKGLLYAVIRHYLLVLKEGYIPAEYITQES